MNKQLHALDNAGEAGQARDIADDGGQTSTGQGFVISTDQRLENLEEKVDSMAEQLGAVLQILQAQSA